MTTYSLQNVILEFAVIFSPRISSQAMYMNWVKSLFYKLDTCLGVGEDKSLDNLRFVFYEEEEAKNNDRPWLLIHLIAKSINMVFL